MTADMTVDVFRARSLDGVPHGFLGRRGGVSTGSYASLNVGLGSPDLPEAIAANRRRAVEAVAPGAALAVRALDDPHAAAAHGPGLVDALAHGAPGAAGTMTIVGPVHVDFARLNTEEFTGRHTHRFAPGVGYTSRAAHPETKEEWRKLVRSLGHRQGCK